MSLILPYKRLNRLLEQEIFEPTLNWGIRMGVASVVPMIWGIATGHAEMAMWITITAECICWVELRGSTGLRFRVLLGGAMLALLFAVLGSITGGNIWLGVVCMLLVGFVSGLFKNLGDRASGLAVCVFVMFIFSNSYPTHNWEELKQRCLYVLTGGGWNLAVGMLASAFIRVQQPYRRSIAVIWKATSALITAVAEGWDGKAPRNGIRDVYLREQAVRNAIDSSLHFYETMAHQASRDDPAEYQLAQIRKATALVATHVIAMRGELETLRFSSLDARIGSKIYALFRAMQHATDRMAIYILTLRPEERLLLVSRIRRINKLIVLLREYPFPDEGSAGQQAAHRIAQLAERTVRLMETCMKRMEEIGTELPVYQSYSLLKTVYVLHPKYLFRNLRLLFNFNTFMVRYALRTAVASALALWIFKWFEIDHGYWLSFTVIIVIQPYFGATIKKARDRMIGTLLGGLAGGLIMRLPAGLFLQEGMLFVCSILMVYYVRKKYAVAAFFITVSLVIVFAIDHAYSPDIIWVRAFSTLGGAAIAVTAGFLLLPAWDSKHLPEHLSAAIRANFVYFRTVFFHQDKDLAWTRFKRTAETKNSNLFDSFIRYMDEPAMKKKHFVLYYQIIINNVRLTRELNNINIEAESSDPAPDPGPVRDSRLEEVRECAHVFDQIMLLVGRLDSREEPPGLMIGEVPVLSVSLTPGQMLYTGRMLIELRALLIELERLLDSK